MSKGPETIAEPGLLLFFFAVIPRLLLFIRYHLLVPFKEKRVLSNHYLCAKINHFIIRTNFPEFAAQTDKHGN